MCFFMGEGTSERDPVSEEYESRVEALLSCLELSERKLDAVKTLFYRVAVSSLKGVSPEGVALKLSNLPKTQIVTLDRLDYLAAAESLVEDGSLEIVEYHATYPTRTIYRVSLKI